MRWKKSVPTLQSLAHHPDLHCPPQASTPDADIIECNEDNLIKSLFEPFYNWRSRQRRDSLACRTRGHPHHNGGIVSRILVIDSANVFIQYVELVVNRYGYRTKGVGSAGEALDALAQERVDLVIAQEKLPDMTWPDFSRKVGTDSDRAGVPVVVLSADPANFDDQGCRGITVAGVRTRPISMRELIAVIQEHLPYKNKRRGIRVPLALKAMLQDGEGFVPCQVLNLSEGGAFIMKKDPFPMGREVHLLLSFQDIESPLEVSGKVVYVVEKARGKHPRGMGIQFGELEAGIRDKLYRYLEIHVSSILGRY